jgi:hypothetical protein
MYAPVDHWSTTQDRPRVLTYIRRGKKLKATQRRPVQGRDMLWLDVNGITILNAYRQPEMEAVIEYVTNLQPPPNTLVVGDFNAKHATFEPGVTGAGGGVRLADWSVAAGIPFIGRPGEATHREGHTLDLAFSNVPFAESRVDKELDAGSDHYPILITIPGRGQEALEQVRWRVPENKLESFAELVGIGTARLPKLDKIKNTEQLEAAVDALTEIIEMAIGAVGEQDRTTGKSAPWWSEECHQAWTAYRAAEDDPEKDWVPEFGEYSP